MAAPYHEGREDVATVVHHIRPVRHIVDDHENLTQWLRGFGVFHLFYLGSLRV